MRSPYVAGGSNRGGGSTKAPGQYSMAERTRVVTAKPNCTDTQKVMGQYSLSERTRVVEAKPQ